MAGAESLYNPISTVEPEVNQPIDANFHAQASPETFGGAVGAALDKFGGAIGNVGQLWGEVQKDKTLNDKLQSNEEQLDHFLTLRGQDAHDAAPDVIKNIDENFQKGADSIWSPALKNQYYNDSRRYQVNMHSRISSHLDEQAKYVLKETNEARRNIALRMAANSGSDD